MGHRVVYLIRLIADPGYDRAALGGLDKARAVEDLTWLLFAAMKDGAPVFYRFTIPCEQRTTPSRTGQASPPDSPAQEDHAAGRSPTPLPGLSRR